MTLASTDRRPRADPVRDDVALPLPLRAADARAGAARRGHADNLAPNRERSVAAADPLLRNALADQLRDRRRDRARAGVRVRDELVGLLTFVGNVFGAPLAIEGLAAFLLESTFLGLWIFGWDRLSPRLHLATLWIAVLGTWLSALLHPRRELVDAAPGRLQARQRGGAAHERLGAPVERVRSSRLRAHDARRPDLRVDRRCSAICCWQFLRGHEVDLFRKAAKLALIVAVPVTLAPARRRQPLRRGGDERAEHEDRRLRGAVEHLPAVRLLGLPDRRLHRRRTRRRASRSRSRRLLSYMATGSFNGEVQGLNELQAQEQRKYGPGNYMPNVRVIYWSMRVMAFAGVLMFLVAALGAWLYWKRKLERARWFQWTAIVAIAFPYIAATRRLDPHRDGPPAVDRAGAAARPSEATSPNVSTTWLGISLGFFITLYVAPRRRRLRADASLRATRPARAAGRNCPRRR